MIVWPPKLESSLGMCLICRLDWMMPRLGEGPFQSERLSCNLTWMLSKPVKNIQESREALTKSWRKPKAEGGNSRKSTNMTSRKTPGSSNNFLSSLGFGTRVGLEAFIGGLKVSRRLFFTLRPYGFKPKLWLQWNFLISLSQLLPSSLKWVETCFLMIQGGGSELVILRT